MDEMLRGMIPAIRPLEFVKLCSEHGVEESIAFVRHAYCEAGEANVAEEYIALARTLVGLPGSYSAHAAAEAFLLRIRSPLVHALLVGYRDMHLYLKGTPMSPPRMFVEKLIRRMRDALKRKEAW